MTDAYSSVVKTAQDYYNSDDADNFYYHVWGGEDIHIGLYNSLKDDIATASQRTVGAMAAQCLASLTPQTKIIDIGSGYGGSARWLAKEFGCQVYCLNLSEAQNNRNRDMNLKQNLADRIEVIDGNFEAIPTENNQFDLAWSQDAILHSGRREKVLEEVDRVLKPGGEFIFTDPMQADDCPDGVLQPVLDRIHLDSLGSFEFYKQQANRLGWQEVAIIDHTHQLVNHYTRVREGLIHRKDQLQQYVSEQYMDRMIQGLGHWIEAGEKGYLAWGIMHLRKPG